MSGDLFTQVMATSAAVSASEAADQSRKARHASEERLEASSGNRFLAFEYLDFEYPEAKWYNRGRAKLEKEGVKVSVKLTDISHLSESKDDFGTVFTVVHLEERCNLGYDAIFVAGSMEKVQNYINNKEE